MKKKMKSGSGTPKTDTEEAAAKNAKNRVKSNKAIAGADSD